MLSAVRAGGAAQIHADILDVCHTAGQHLLRVFQNALTVDRRIAAQLLGLCLRLGNDLCRILLAAADDFLLTGQVAGFFLGLLDNTFRFDTGVFHDLLAG